MLNIQHNVPPLLAAVAAVDGTAAAETFVKHAESYPITVGFFVLLGCFLSLLAGIAVALRWAARTYWPRYLEQQERNVVSRETEGEKTRAHIADLMKSRGEEAAADVRGAHSEIGVKVEAVQRSIVDVSGKVADVSGKVDKVDARISGIHAVVKALASKQGITILAFVLSSAAAAYTTAYTSSRLTQTTSYTCDPGCTAPEYCCSRNTCCRNVNATSGNAQPAPTKDLGDLAPKPHSAALVRVDYGDDPFAAADARAKMTSL